MELIFRHSSIDSGRHCLFWSFHSPPVTLYQDRFRPLTVVVENGDLHDRYTSDLHPDRLPVLWQQGDLQEELLIRLPLVVVDDLNCHLAERNTAGHTGNQALPVTSGRYSPSEWLNIT